MNWNLLEFFADEQVSVTPISVSSTTGDDGFSNVVETAQAAVSGLLWTQSAASRYFGQSFQEDVSEVFITGDKTNISNTGKVKYGTTTYEVDSVENVANQDSVYLVGLKGRK